MGGGDRPRKEKGGMRCWRCGQRNRGGATTCSRCHADLTPRSPLSAAYRRQKDAGPDPNQYPDQYLDHYAERDGDWEAFAGADAHAGGAYRAPHASQGRALSITLALAVVLALAGLGAVHGAELLAFAMRVSGPDDVATIACTAYTTQRYPLLTQRIDPAPVPPAVTGAFNPASVETQLRALDKTQGIVQRCDLGRFSGGDPAAQYPITLWRAHAPLAATIVLLLRHEPNGAWMISRATNFAGSSA
jgi:hypothetical protein